jgi:hypothetical protein
MAQPALTRTGVSGSAISTQHNKEMRRPNREFALAGVAFMDRAARWVGDGIAIAHPLSTCLRRQHRSVEG